MGLQIEKRQAKKHGKTIGETCSRGIVQVPGINFDEAYAPFSQHASMRMLFSSWASKILE
jgi:hypothetical protein